MTKKRLDTRDEKTGQTVTTNVPTEGRLDRSSLEDDLEIIQEQRMKDKAEALAFMEEPVRILVHESTDEMATEVVELNVNGVNQFIIRGREQVVRRKFVECLARARQASIRTRTGVQGDQVINQIRQHTAVRFPFSIVEDRNPRGHDWLRALLAQA